ncbi:hypothetical protein NKH77_11290 [Streptomyces sp. M19]
MTVSTPTAAPPARPLRRRTAAQPPAVLALPDDQPAGAARCWVSPPSPRCCTPGTSPAAVTPTTTPSPPAA